MTTFEEELRVEEYKALRAEIGQRIHRKLQLTGGYVTLALGLCAFALKEQTAEALVLSPIAVAVGLTLILFEDRHIRLLSSYVEVFYEDDRAGPKWELALHNQRERKGKLRTFMLWFSGRALIPITPLAASGAAWIKLGASSALPTLWNGAMLLAVVVAIAAVWQSSIAYSGPKLALTVSKWKRLKKEWNRE